MIDGRPTRASAENADEAVASLCLPAADSVSLVAQIRPRPSPTCFNVLGTTPANHTNTHTPANGRFHGDHG